METDITIVLFKILCSGLFVWSLATTLALLDERRELKTLQESKDDLRESMSNTNYLLYQQLERVKRENKALRRQNRQLRKGQQKQDNIKIEYNDKTNHQNEKKRKYVVKNRLTGAICGEFETYGQAGKWVEEYTHEQNEGLSPDAPEYCSPFDFLLLSK